MNGLQIHPEDLLDRARRQPLSNDEQRLLQDHLARCSACRFELALAPALYAHIQLGVEDQAMIARAIASSRRVPQADRRGQGRRMIPAAAMVAAVLLAGVAMASAGAYVWRRHSIAALEAAPAAPRARAIQRPVEDGARGQPIIVPIEEPVPALERPTPTPPPLASAANRAPPIRLASTVGAKGCVDRFRRANELGRAGAFGEAVRLYLALRQACAGSSEELSSRVFIGRIYLDRLREPALALAAFDGYLASASSGALREDAMIGRALALGKLNRPTDEARAWQILLSAYPDTFYADKARARLGGPR